MSPRRSWAVARNELRVLRRDPFPLVVLLVMPLIMAPLFRTTFRAALVVSGHPGASGADFAVPAQAVQFAFFLAPFTGFMFFRDHGWNTWTRLRASSATTADIIAGKALPMFGIGVAQLALLFAVGIGTLDFHVRNALPALLFLGTIYVVCAVTLGIALTAVLRTSQQLNAFGFLFAIVLGALGGALVPLNTLPGWARHFAPITPQYWTMRGYNDVVVDGRGAGAILVPALVLLSFITVFVVVALRRMRADDVKVGWS